MRDVTHKELSVCMESALKFWPFGDKVHYKGINDDGSVTVTLTRPDVAFLDFLMQHVVSLGKFARIAERNQHEDDWNNIEKDWRNIGMEMLAMAMEQTSVASRMEMTGSVDITLSREDFIALHLMLHQIDYAAELTKILQGNENKTHWTTAKEHPEDISDLAMSQAISGIRLFTELGGDPERFAGYFRKEIRKKKTKTDSVYGRSDGNTKK